MGEIEKRDLRPPEKPRGVSRGRRNRYGTSSVWTELLRSRRSTTSKLCHPIPERQSKAKLRIEDGAHQQLLRRVPARGTAFQARTKLGQARSELLSADRRETYFLVRAFDRGLEASRVAFTHEERYATNARPRFPQARSTSPRFPF